MFVGAFHVLLFIQVSMYVFFMLSVHYLSIQYTAAFKWWLSRLGITIHEVVTTCQITTVGVQWAGQL